MSLTLLLTISGGLETLVGAMALILPASVIEMLLGTLIDPRALVLTRLFGAGIFALGLACLMARKAFRSPAGLAVTYAITSYNILAAAVLFWATTSLVPPSPILWAAAIGHALLSALFVHALVVLR